VRTSHPYYGATSSIPARPKKIFFGEGTPELASPCRLFGRRNQLALAPHRAILKQGGLRFNGNRRESTMRDQRDLTQDAVLRAQIATANKLIAEQSVAFARAHSAIERAIESLREPDGEGPSVC
jgi:hypothetical protein